MEIHWPVFRIPKKRRFTRKDFSEEIGLSSVLEMKKNDMERSLTNKKENVTMKPIR